MSRAVEIARTWIGTPYVHQASCRGAGCDCLGLVRGIWRELLGSEPRSVPPYTSDWDEPTRDEVLWQVARDVLVPRPDAPLAPGRVLLFRMRAGGVAKHLGLVSLAGDAPRFIHAYSGHGVLETRLTAPWRRRVVAQFDFPTES